MSRLSAGLSNEDITERMIQARHSWNCITMVVLMALSLLPSAILMGGFKYVIYLVMKDDSSTESNSDWVEVDFNLTILGCFAAMTQMIGRLLFAWLERRKIAEAENLLRFALILQYGILSLTYLGRAKTDMLKGLAYSLYLITSLVNGAVVSLMPQLCLKVFGPSTHFPP